MACDLLLNDDSKPDQNKAVDVLIIAGEHSGDEHAALVIRELLQEQPHLAIYAVGGPKMRAAGATLLYDMMAKSVVGFWEVLKDLKHFKALMHDIVAWVRARKPRIICFVDYPGFNLRLAKKLYDQGLATQAGGPIKLAYYISPQIWAWKSWRRFAMARWLDALGVIFPFEVDCYKDTRLPTTFVGHPFIQPEYKLPVHYDPKGCILLLPGSRRASVKKILPVMLEAFRYVWQKYPQTTATIIYPSETIKAILKEALLDCDDIKAFVKLVPNTQGCSARALLTSSGTMSLACTLAGIPGAIVYKTSWFTYIFGKLVVRIQHLGIGSILLKREAYPEFIQAAACSKRVGSVLEDCITNPQKYEYAARDAHQLRHMLGEGLIGMPSPAQWLMKLLVDNKA